MFEDVPRVRLLEGPTPIERLSIPGVWVKREDRAGTLYGGNKVRKLEFLLGAAVDGGGGDVLTLGAVGSNHLLATAVYGEALGLRVQAVVSPQPDAPNVRRNVRALHAHAEKLWVARSDREVPIAWAKAWVSIRAFGGWAPTTFPIGGSNTTGALGWVLGGLEIAAQVAAGEMPPPDRVVVALGSGGTAAGLLVGLRLAGLASEVVGVRTAPAWLANRTRVLALARRAMARTGQRVRLDGLTLVHDQFGEGYGVPTAAGDAAMARAAEEGLTLEPTYTAKAFAGMLATPGGTTLFVNTYNSRPLEPLLASALREVPPSLVGLLA